jgi:secreted trypsin-like serine protease
VTLRRPLLLALASLGLLTPSAPAIVGGTDVPEGERGYVAFITIDQVASCTGTLVTPTFVVTAGHCSNLGTGTPVNVPIGKAGQEIEVTLGSVKRDDPAGEKPAVKRVIVHPDYVFTENGGSSYDVALLELATPSKQTPVQIVAKGEEALFAPGTMAQIAGFGLTEENGSSASTMQQAEVPITTDEYAKGAYDSFEAGTQIGAGFPQGGVDSCQGDSGGPLLVKAPDGSLRLVGDTSYGDGCARAGKPGIYGRLGSDQMRDFIVANAPDAVAKPSAATTPPASGPTTQQQQSQPQSQPSSETRTTPAKKKARKRRTPCSRLHRGSARHNRSARHKREVRRCVKKRRARARAQQR